MTSLFETVFLVDKIDRIAGNHLISQQIKQYLYSQTDHSLALKESFHQRTGFDKVVHTLTRSEITTSDTFIDIQDGVDMDEDMDAYDEYMDAYDEDMDADDEEDETVRIDTGNMTLAEEQDFEQTFGVKKSFRKSIRIRNEICQCQMQYIVCYGCGDFVLTNSMVPEKILCTCHRYDMDTYLKSFW